MTYSAYNVYDKEIGYRVYVLVFDEFGQFKNVVQFFKENYNELFLGDYKDLAIISKKDFENILAEVEKNGLQSLSA